MQECLNTTVQIALKTLQDIDFFLFSLAKIPSFEILISFFLSVATSKISFKVFLVANPNFNNFIDLLKKIEKITSEKEYKNFVSDYSITTGLLVTAIVNWQFEDKVRFPIVIIYSVLGPFLLRDKLYKIIKGKEYSDKLESVKGVKKETGKYYSNLLNNKVEYFTEQIRKIREKNENV